MTFQFKNSDMSSFGNKILPAVHARTLIRRGEVGIGSVYGMTWRFAQTQSYSRWVTNHSHISNQCYNISPFDPSNVLAQKKKKRLQRHMYGTFTDIIDVSLTCTTVHVFDTPQYIRYACRQIAANILSCNIKWWLMEGPGACTFMQAYTAWGVEFYMALHFVTWTSSARGLLGIEKK